MISVPAVAARRHGIAIATIRDGGRRVAASLSRVVHAIRREHVLWLVLTVLFLLYALALVLEPSTAGKGGR